VDFKLITADVDVSEIHKLFDSFVNVPPIDRTTDILFGAFDGKRLVAVASATPAHRNKKRFLWSNFLIVDPEYRRQGIGFGLKQFQRSWALKHRYTTIMWSFNPLQSVLAKFYFHDLGATANTLHLSSNSENCDLEVVWRLKDRHVKALAAREQVSGSVESIPFALEVGKKGNPTWSETAFDTEFNAMSRIEIPIDVASSPAVDEWSQALKTALSQGFLKKYSIVDFEVKDERCWYILTAPTPWFLYVVECSDHTLYTGITSDPNRRIKLHNAGRGAAYTATRTPVRLMAAWKFPDRSAAIRAEIAFKRLSRERKLQHINAELDFGGVQFLSHLAMPLPS
jgi:putative endonuclease